jgi:hypothetical protein
VLLLVQWDKFYIETDKKDIIVSYKVLNKGIETKSGKITIDNIQKNKPWPLFQSWKRATTEFLGRYNTDLTEMSRTIVNRMMAEL